MPSSTTDVSASAALSSAAGLMNVYNHSPASLEALTCLDSPGLRSEICVFACRVIVFPVGIEAACVCLVCDDQRANGAVS